MLSNMTSPETDDVSNDRTTIQDNTAPQEDINEIAIEEKNGSEVRQTAFRYYYIMARRPCYV